MSWFPRFLDHAPLSSYRCGNMLTVARYGRALREMKVVANVGRNPDELALHPLCIAVATTLAAGGYISERVIQIDGSWRVRRVPGVHAK